MKERDTGFLRPALWGFFICTLCAGVLLLWRTFIPAYKTAHWDSGRTERRLQDEQYVREAFQNRVERLTGILEHVSRDSILPARVSIQDIPSVLKVFQILNSYRQQDNLTLDFVDSTGNLLAWSGPSIAHQYADVLGKDPAKSFVRVTQMGLRTYLTVGERRATDTSYVLVSEPLELNYPISNRFVQKVSISEELSRALKVKVSFQIPRHTQLLQGEHVVLIKDLERKELIEFLIEERKLENEIAGAVEFSSVLLGLCLALGSIFLTYAGVRWISQGWTGLIPTTLCIFILWLVRLMWREMEFPAALIGGWLFDPNVYASNFIGGLSSSLGELILSIMTAAISTWFVFSHTVLGKHREENAVQKDVHRKRIGSLVLIFTLSLCVLWCFRGMNEALRSFVFDSTIQFNNPSEILLDGTSSIMHLNVILLGISLLCLSTSLIWKGKKILALQFPSSELKTRILLLLIFFLGIPIFIILDESPQVLLFGSIFFMIFSIIFVEYLARWKKSGISSASLYWRIAVWMVVGSFFLGTPIVHQRLQERERRDVEDAVREFLRPSDSWLTYVILDGLQVSADGLRNELILHDLEEAKKSNLAFVLWTQTLLGKNGYNSAIVLYDKKGNEADRFTVGMSKQEQKEILTRVFEGEEEAVHVAGRTGQKSLGKLYGSWITVHDSSGQIEGSIALLLSEHQRTFFHEYETEPLRQFANRFENDIVREIAIQEYRADTLVYSTGSKLSPDRFLPPDIKTAIQNASTTAFWKDIPINGLKAHTIYMEDASVPNRIVSMSLETLDIRWDLFSYLKEFFICLIILSVTGLYTLMQRRGTGVLITLGFKDKLFLGFACISLIPLIVLSYYNRQLVAERVQDQVETTLYHELSQLQDRISAYIMDEEDFVLGIDDDFCEALAAEYGIDFSVYRHAFIQASSRSELYRAELLDRRLNGDVFSSMSLGGKSYYLMNEKIGSVEYVVGYTPLLIGDIPVGVLSIPTLNREKDIESELAQRNAYVFGAYAIIFGIALAAGGLLAFRFARPLNQLTTAAKEVSEGNLQVQVHTRSRDEIGILAQSFNEMVLKLQKSRKELAAHERESAWKEMAKQVAHEIRNPLTPIKLSIQHVRQAFKDKAPDREEILQRVTQTVIEQIDALSRIAAEFSNFGTMPESKFEKLHIDDLLKETIDLFREVRGIQFIDRCAASSVMIVADHDQLRRVFINIIRNAIQAMSKGGTISIVTALEEHLCSIKITDNGPGISNEIRTKIFEPNFSTKTEGMGLGLAIARKIIENHGGSITCLSQHGKGTTFEIQLPV
jgi:two-component system, NtrC family, nitrogen regulation sensor histidine kinase NtrY